MVQVADGGDIAGRDHRGADVNRIDFRGAVLQGHRAARAVSSAERDSARPADRLGLLAVRAGPDVRNVGGPVQALHVDPPLAPLDGEGPANLSPVVGVEAAAAVARRGHRVPAPVETRRAGSGWAGDVITP